MRIPGKVHLKTLLVLLACLAGAATTAFGAGDQAPGEFFTKETPIEITADRLSYNKVSNTYFASGNVELFQEGTTLKADDAVLDMSAGLANATGNVHIIDEGGNTLSGDDLTFDIRTKVAIVTNARLFYKEDNIHITGKVIKKTGRQSYNSDRATFTTCDCDEGDTPAWHFSARRTKVTIGEYMTGRHALFHVKGVPVAYSPVFRVPIKRGRQTGFLTPEPGVSKLRGFSLGLPFFWAISESKDATFYLDAQTARGFGAGAEYRYYRTRKSYGEAYYYHFRERDIARVREFRQSDNNLSRPLSATNRRWQFRLDHTELLPYGARFSANINVVSDDEFLLDFGKTNGEKSTESLESNISFSKSFSVYSIVAQLRTFDNLLVQDDSPTLKKLPEVTFSASDQHIWKSPVYLSAGVSYIHFVRDAGTKGHRLDVRPRFSLPLNAGGYFDLTPSITPRGTFYIVKNNPEGRYIDRYLYEANVDITTTFVRIFRSQFQLLDAVKHTLRPKVTYTYIPEALQADLPQFDAVDNVAAANRVTYSLNTTVTGRSTSENAKKYQDYLYMDISQSFDINESTRKITSLTEERRPFSDITAEAILRPTDYSKLTGRGSYNVYDYWFTNYDTELELKIRTWHIKLARRFVRGTLNYFEAYARAPVTKRIDLTYAKRFSFDEDRSLETSYGAEYRQQCWKAILSYSERLEEKLLFLNFELLSLGRVAGAQATFTSQ